MSFITKKHDYATKLGKIVDIYLHKCKYTDAEWIAYGSGTLQTTMTNATTGNITLSGTQATQFNEPFVWVQFGGSTELVKCAVVSDTVLTIVTRGDFGTTAVEHSIGTSAIIKHSGEVDGTCYGLTSCSAVNNYVKGLELKFRFPSSNLDFGEKYFHGLSSESYKSPTVKPSESIGSRGSSSITILDGLENDSYVPYSANKVENGTLWTKLLARNPYFEGRKIVVYEGFLEPVLNLDNYQRREYIIDDVQLSDGKVSISCLDPLILTEDKTSKAPVTTPLTLLASIIDSSTAVTYKETVPFYFGAIGTVHYVRIDSEVIQLEVASDYTSTILSRAVGGTGQADHDENSTIQEVLHYSKVNVVSIIKDLIERFTPIDTVYLDDYTGVISATSTIKLTAFITKPTEVKKLIDELLQTGLLTMWFSPTESKIKIVRSADPNIQPISLNEENNIGRGTFKETRVPDDQITRFGVGFGVNDITKESGVEYFSVIYNPISFEVEQAKNKGEVNEKATFLCRWLLNDGDDPQIAYAIADNWISKSAELPTEIELELDAQDVGVNGDTNLDLASIINVTTTQRVNADGSPQSKDYQIVNITDKGNLRYLIKGILYQQPISGQDVDLVINGAHTNYILSDNLVITDLRKYTVLIDTGAVIGSNSTSLAAFDMGSLPAGVSIELIVRGAIKGMGGKGGNGGIARAPNPADFATIVYDSGGAGGNGGLALNVTAPLSIYAGGGAIYGGGGGAAGRYSVASSISTTFVYAGNGGSGGMGYGTSSGGNAGIAEIEDGIGDVGIRGNIGNNSAPGILGGVTGGRYGAAGDSDRYSDNGIIVTVPGGSAGAPIKKNGYSVTILSGAVSIDGNIRGTIEA